MGPSTGLPTRGRRDHKSRVGAERLVEPHRVLQIYDGQVDEKLGGHGVSSRLCGAPMSGRFPRFHHNIEQ